MESKPRGGSAAVFVLRFVDELMLYSGQYALFYLMMVFAREGGGFFLDEDHALLLGTLILQTAALARWGNRVLPRLLLSLVAPAIYALREAGEGIDFLLDLGHAQFWVFSVAVAALQAASRSDAPRLRRMIFEFVITALNVAAFIAVYVYFDLQLTLEEHGVGGGDLREALSVFNAGAGFAEFFSDKAHVYMLIGGSFLALTIAVGRVKILNLTERINELFGQYVDPSFRDEIVRGSGGRPRKRELCILFSDIRDFTTLSEREDPVRVSLMLNAYFTEWEETVTRYGGAVDKYIGDAVMAVFGARGGAPCDAAASCALELLHRLPRIKERLAASGLPFPEAIGVGIDYGEVIMGDLGSKRRKNFTVIGDRVNTASRLEALCKEYRRTCIVSDAVASRLSPPNAARFEELGAAQVKGRTAEVRILGLRQ